MEGEGVIRAMRNLAGSTQWQEATPGTIRGDYAHNTTQILFIVRIRLRQPLWK